MLFLGVMLLSDASPEPPSLNKPARVLEFATELRPSLPSRPALPYSPCLSLFPDSALAGS